MHLPGHRKKLLQEGAHADAVVTESQGARLTEGGGWSAYDLVLEVHFPDGSQGELRERVDAADIGKLRGRVGEVLPVRYDPEDPSSAVIDVPAIQAEVDEANRLRDEEAVARGRRAIEGQPDTPPAGSPAAALQGIGKQLAELTELRRALQAGEIGQDEYERRRQQIVATEPPG
jgi:hypothetical protein